MTMAPRGFLPPMIILLTRSIYALLLIFQPLGPSCLLTSFMFLSWRLCRLNLALWFLLFLAIKQRLCATLGAFRDATWSSHVIHFVLDALGRSVCNLWPGLVYVHVSWGTLVYHDRWLVLFLHSNFLADHGIDIHAILLEQVGDRLWPDLKLRLNNDKGID